MQKGVHRDDKTKHLSSHFIRPLGDKQITIQTYNPPADESSVAVEVGELQIEPGPAMRLSPKVDAEATDGPKKVIRVGNTVRITKKVSTKK